MERSLRPLEYKVFMPQIILYHGWIKHFDISNIIPERLLAGTTTTKKEEEEEEKEIDLLFLANNTVAKVKRNCVITHCTGQTLTPPHLFGTFEKGFIDFVDET